MKLVYRLMGLLLILISSNLYAQKIKVACVGNSVTAGYLLANPQQESYPAQLQQMLGNNYEVGNFGHSGATLLKQGHRPYYQMPEFADLLRFDADIAVIHLGLNDTDPRNWPNYKDRFRADYQWLLDTLKRNNPKLKIFICKLTPIFSGHPRFKSGTRDWYWQIQSEIVKVAEANRISLINLNTPLANRPDLFADNLHPDKTGAGIIAKTVYQAITGNFDGFMLNPFFANHMVLQRNRNITVYGKANAGDRIVVKFNQLTRSIVTDNTGSWIAEFPAMKAGGPYNLEATCGSRKAMVNDILIGDVWLCSGQSNMAFPLKAAATGKQTLSHLPKELPLRLLKYNVIAETDNVAWDERTLNKVNNLEYFSGTWRKIDSASASAFSAVGFYFGEKIAREEHVPVGLIELAVGGSPIESWIDRRTLENDNLLVDLIDPWRKSDFIQDWVRGRADVNLKNAGNPKQRHPYAPAYNYEAGVARLIQSPIAGVIWYQGESNAHNTELYSYQLPVLVKSWRQQWKQNFPFYYVQLSSINRPSWPFFRDAQRRLEAVIPQSAMAVSSDLGDSLNVHPTQKRQIGERLALLALKNTYRHHVIDRGPVPLNAVRRKNIVDVSFASAKALQPADGRQIKGFEVEDDKGKHWPVVATVSGNHVLLSTPRGQKPIRVLYGWQPFTRANLVNEARLPASTFYLPL